MSVSQSFEMASYVAILASVVAVVLALYSSSIARRAVKEARTYALTTKWEIESLKAVRAREERSHAEGEEAAQPEVGRELVTKEGVEGEALEPSKVEDLAGLLEKLRLEAVMLFDSLGQVIDYAGSLDGRQVAAMMADLASAAGIGSGVHSYLWLGDGLHELLARIELINEKIIYVYAKLRVEPSRKIANAIMEAARQVLQRMTSR